MNTESFDLLDKDFDLDPLKITFRNLDLRKLDIGFYTEVVRGKDYHHVTRDVTLSAQRFQDGTLTNLLYVSAQPFPVRLEDEVIPYYSDFIEWRYVLSGHFAVRFEDETVTFNENEICFINSSVLHREWVSGSEGITININMDRAFFTERFLSNIALTPLQKYLRSNLLQRGSSEKYLRFTPHPSELDEVREDVATILQEVRFQKPGYQDICRGYIVRLMDTLSADYRYNLSPKDMDLYYSRLFESVSDYMKANLSVVKMSNLIETFHYQTNFFNNLIKRYTGLTYSDYLISLRIEQAKILLETTDLTVDEILLAIGYHNKGFFYNRFLEANGCNPAAYRKSHKKADA